MNSNACAFGRCIVANDHIQLLNSCCLNSSGSSCNDLTEIVSIIIPHNSDRDGIHNDDDEDEDDDAATKGEDRSFAIVIICCRNC